MYKDKDPEILQKMKDDTKVSSLESKMFLVHIITFIDWNNFVIILIQILLEAANRWTDNIFSVKSWIKTKFMIEENKLDKQFDIPPDLDHVDEKIFK